MVTQRSQNSDLDQINLLTTQVIAPSATVTKAVYRWISDNKIPQSDTNIEPTAFQKGPSLIISDKSAMSY